MATDRDLHEGTVFATGPFGFILLFCAEDGVGHGLGQVIVNGSILLPLSRRSLFNPEWEIRCVCTPDVSHLLFPQQQGLGLVFKKGFSVFLYTCSFIFKHIEVFLQKQIKL